MIKLFSDFRTIWLGIIAVIPAGIWAADTVFQTDKEAAVGQIQMMEYDIQDLQVQMGYARDAHDKEMFHRRIEIKESQIRQMKEKLK